MIRVTSLGFHSAKGFHGAKGFRKPQDSAIVATAHHYVLAGQPVVFESKVSALESYYIGPASRQFSELLTHFSGPDLLNATNAELKYTGQAPLYEQVRKVEFWRSGARAQVNVDGRAICQLDFEESHIHLLSSGSFDDRLNLEVIVGPALVLLLAQMDIYCLHAGAVTTPVGNLAIVAESGVGKSTLSAHRDGLWQQLSDDILPIMLLPSLKPELLPDYPQLKFTNAAVPDCPKGDQSLDFLIRIDPQPGDAFVLKEIKQQPAMLQIVRHTVAAKLFDAPAMEQHTLFAKNVANEVPMLELSYPRKLSQLPQLRMQIIEELARYSSRV